MSRILIFSRSIRSGKTTELKEVLPFMNRVNGILCPDIDNLRVLRDLSKGESHPLQVSEAIASQTFELGRFHFLYSAFERARDILTDTLKEEVDWTIVDEVGKLEVQRNTGFEPALSQLIDAFRDTSDEKGRLLLVVRDYLLEEAIEHYRLEDAVVKKVLKPWKNP